MALTTSEVDILRHIQKHGWTTPTQFVEAKDEYDPSKQVSVRKALIRLEEQGFLVSEVAVGQMRKYTLSPNVKKVDFNEIEKI